MLNLTYEEIIAHCSDMMGSPCTFYAGKTFEYIDSNRKTQVLKFVLYEYQSESMERPVKRWVVWDGGVPQRNWTGGICA